MASEPLSVILSLCTCIPSTFFNTQRSLFSCFSLKVVLLLLHFMRSPVSIVYDCTLFLRDAVQRGKRRSPSLLCCTLWWTVMGEREREGEGTTVRSPPPASRFGARCVWLKHRQTKTHLNREWENTMWALRLRWSIKENVWYSSQRANLFSSRLFPFPEFNVLQRKPVCYVYSCPVLVHHSLFSMCVCVRVGVSAIYV